ncbi:MAG: 4-(cytidine 5'-diphospho)-2-C-methyl-D-erythritol kinase [Bacteroides sp.]|nr:4-(cytidine 5'-diphospho)-2-C-methyl-D-erythritol kinase [Bacteroides sp.]
MSLASDRKSITVPAYAKINLFLDIIGALPSGYHSLNTVMQQIELHDDVTVSRDRGEGITVSCDDPALPVDKRNVAYGAAELFVKETGLSAEIKIKIQKRIPLMSGLGGSSTDGAAVLKALNTLCGMPLSRDRLEKLGAALGADVPFCLRGNAAICRGIGDKMTDAAGLEHCSVLIVKPDFSCDTRAAYGLYDKSPIKSAGEPRLLLSALKQNDLPRAGEGLYNIFEKLYGDGRIEEIKKALLLRGAVGASLSGSGSAVYGLFESEKAARSAAGEMKYPFVFVTKPVFSLEK